MGKDESPKQAIETPNQIGSSDAYVDQEEYSGQNICPSITLEIGSAAFTVSTELALARLNDIFVRTNPRV